ncbi:unnamed protein product [Sphagnum compactum]
MEPNTSYRFAINNQRQDISRGVSSFQCYKVTMCQYLIVVVIVTILLIPFRSTFLPNYDTTIDQNNLHKLNVDNQDDKSTSLHDRRKLVDVLHDIFDTAAEFNRKGSLNVVDTQTEPNFPMFVCDGCERCDVCTFIRPLGYFAPVLTTIFKYILGDGRCNRGPLVVDVGANMGYFSAYAAALGCKVASFEPNKHPRQYLEATAALLDPNHTLWKVYPMAIGEEGKEVEFIEDVGWGGGRVSTHKVNLTGQEHLLGMQKEKVKKQIVELIQLDAVVKEDILLLKIDTEGYEEFVIQGSKSVFKDHNVHNVLIEVKTQNDPTRRDFMYHLMKEVGHFTHVYMFHDVYNSTRLNLRTFDCIQNGAYMEEVTDIIANKKYDEKLTSQDYWFRKEALPLF